MEDICIYSNGGHPFEDMPLVDGRGDIFLEDVPFVEGGGASF